MIKRILGLFGVILSLCLLVSPAWSGTAGKITGRVTDANGKPLPGVNVFLQGMRSGAVSDADGYYLILSVEPGVYELKASIIGFETVREKNVEVLSDRTTTKNFTLKETAVAGAEVVVQAQRPLVEVDRTGSEAKISMKEIGAVPILRNVQQHLQYVAGVDPVYSSGNGVRMRREHGYVTQHWQTWTLDGMELTILDNSFQSPLQYNSIPVTAVSEIGVVTGGASASQASSAAGVINIVTREGTRSLQGGLDFRGELPGKRHFGPNVYDANAGQRGGTNGLWQDKLKWNDPTWVNETDPVTGKQIHVKQDYTGAVGNFEEGWLSGPLGENATFVVSGKRSQPKQTYPSPARIGLPQWNIFGKLTFTPTQNLKLKLGYNQSNEPNWGSRSYGGSDRRGPNTNLFLVRDFTGYEQQWKNLIVYLTATHTISPKTFHEFQVGFFGTNMDTTANTDPTTTAYRKDKSGYFNLDRMNRTNLQVDYDRRYNFRYDFTSQVSRRNLLKVGFTYQIFHNMGWIYQQASPSAASIYVTAKDSQPGKRYIVQRFASYIENKLEFQGFVMNTGLRYDALWGGSTKTLGSWYKNMAAYRTYNAYLTRTPREPIKPMVSWAPRIGIAHPITAKSAVRFDFGRYYKPGNFGQIWTESWNTTNAQNHPTLDGTWADEPWAPGGGWRLDSGFHNPSGITNTNEFEVAGDWNFVSDFVLDITTYYRRTEYVNGASWRIFYDPGGSQNYTSAQTPSARMEAKGIEASIYKSLSHNFSFRASVDVGWSMYRYGGNGPYRMHYFPDSTYIAGPNYFLVDANDNPRPLTVKEIQELGAKANAILKKQFQDERTTFEFVEAARPFREYPGLSDKDRNRPEVQGLWYRLYWVSWQSIFVNPPPTTLASFQFLWSTPSSWGPGPKVGGAKLLGGIQANLVWRLDSGNGISFTPPGKKNQFIHPGPIYVRADFNFQKTFEGGRVRPTIYAEVFNVFNSYVDRTGTDAYLRWGLQLPTPNNINYLKYGDPSPFRGGDNGGPRYVNVGVRVGF